MNGFLAPGFEGVGEAFTANFDLHGDVGAACAVFINGEKVVDIWGGIADPATEAPYEEDTLQLVFSTTKGATAIWIKLSQAPRWLRFEVRDDGAGYPSDAGHGRGLRNMHDRIEAVGGQVSVESEPGHGTRVTGMIPLP